MEKVTEKDLDGILLRLNTITRNPKMYMVDHVIQPGNYHLDGAFGGWSLRQTTNNLGGETDVLGSGYTTKKHLYELISAYIKGYLARKGEES